MRIAEKFRNVNWSFGKKLLVGILIFWAISMLLSMVMGFMTFVLIILKS